MGSAPTKRGLPASKEKKPRKHTPKASDLEIELRLRSIEDRLKMGLSPAEVVAELVARIRLEGRVELLNPALCLPQRGLCRGFGIGQAVQLGTG